MVAVAGGGDIRCAPYHTFGSQELSDAAVAALQGRRACLLANHGVIALGATLPAALALAAEVENLAAQYCAALAIGDTKLLDDTQMQPGAGEIPHLWPPGRGRLRAHIRGERTPRIFGCRLEHAERCPAKRRLGARG